MIQLRGNMVMAAEKDVEANGAAALAPLQPISTGSTLEEALDAAANVDIPQTAFPNASEKPSDLGPPPNGGFHAWLQVAGSFFLFFNSWWVCLDSCPPLGVSKEFMMILKTFHNLQTHTPSH